MAFIKVSNKDGVKTKIPYEIYEENKNTLISGDYNIDNGMIRQKVSILNSPGVYKLAYPIAFRNQINGVIITKCNEELKRFIRTYEINLDYFNLEIIPNSFPSSEEIVFSVFGY